MPMNAECASVNVARRPAQSPIDMDMLKAERHEMLLHELFERQEAQTPERVAVVYENQHLTFRALNRQANLLAQRLRDRSASTEPLIGIYTRRGPQMIVAILGAWKSGGAYVPLDPNY